MATTAPALLPNHLTHMHHFRSSSDGHPHKLHKHRSHPHMAFPETEKAEELRDDHSSQSSSNDAKSERSRKDSMKRTVKKVKKYLSRRFSGHHPHQEGNYSVISGGLVGAQFAYAALGRPASTPSSPSGGPSDQERFIPLAGEQHRVTSGDGIPVPSDNDHSPDASPDGDRLHHLPLQPTDMDVQTPDHSFETNADDDAVHPSDPFDQSFDSIDSRGSASSFELPDIHFPVPELPPSTSLPDIPAEKVEHETQPEAQKEPTVPAVDGGDERAIESSESASVTGSLTILDSVESLHSLNDAPEPEPESESQTEPVPPPAVNEEPIPLALAPGSSSEVAETEEVLPELSHATNKPIPDHSIHHVVSPEDNAQPVGTGAEPSLNEKSPLPPTAYVPYDDNLSELSFELFDIPYFKATVVALAASGLGIMLANGAYRLLRTL